MHDVIGEMNTGSDGAELIQDELEAGDWLQLQLSSELAGQRLDQCLATLLPDFSRNRLQQWIKAGRVLVDGCAVIPRHPVKGTEHIELHWQLEPEARVMPTAMELDVRYADEDILVINKPAGLVVHPAPGNWEGTLQHGLLYLRPELAQLPRAGIIHRLDKDTSGLMVVAASHRAHRQLVAMLQERDVQRHYLALVVGAMTAGGSVDEPIGRHPRIRTRMAVTAGGRPALTHYRVLERFQHHTLLQVKLETGRTHQIRVHLAHVHYPVLGDPVYGGRMRIPPHCPFDLREQLQGFRRQALHAERLGFVHPVLGEYLEWQVPPPADFIQLLEVLRASEAGTAL